jgi:hypothetical protein
MQDHQLAGSKRQRRVSSSLVVAELDLEDAGREYFDDRTDLTTLEPSRWESFGQSNDVY